MSDLDVSRLQQQSYRQGQRDILAKCIDALEQMLDVDPCDCDRCRYYAKAQAILRALEDKP